MQAEVAPCPMPCPARNGPAFGRAAPGVPEYSIEHDEVRASESRIVEWCIREDRAPCIKSQLAFRQGHSASRKKTETGGFKASQRIPANSAGFNRLQLPLYCCRASGSASHVLLRRSDVLPIDGADGLWPATLPESESPITELGLTNGYS